MRSRIGFNLHAIWTSRNGHAPIHLVVFISRLLGIMRILIGHKQRKGRVFRHLLHALNRNITRHICSVMIVPMLIARFIVKFYTVQKIVITLIPDKLRKIRPQLRRYPHITRCAQMPLAHPTGSIPRIIQCACQCARPLGNIPPIAQRICLRPVLPRNQRRAKRRTNRRIGITIAKQNAFSRQLVQMWRVNIFRSHTSHCKSVHLIGKKK